MKIRYPLICALLAAVMTATGCGIITFPSQNTTPSETTATPEETESTTSTADTQTNDPDPVEPDTGYEKAQTLVNGLRDFQFRSDAVFIAQIESYSDFVPTVERNPSAVQSASLLRNRLVQEKYGTHVRALTVADRSQLMEQLRAASKADEYYADLIAAPIEDIGLLKEQGVLLNLNSLPFTDYTAEYFNRDAMLQASGGYVYYAAIGSMTENPASEYVCFINTAMAQKAFGESVYTLSERGNWTWDQLLACKSALPQGASLVCTATDIQTFSQVVFLSTGSHFVTCTMGQTPTLSYAGKHTDAVVASLRQVVPLISHTGQPAVSAFAAGQSLLCIAPLSAAAELKSMADGWGVLPLPKCLETDSYFNVASDQSIAICVPSTGTDAEQTGFLLQALFAASYQHVKNAYLTDYKLEHLETNAAILSLASMMKNPTRYDFTQFFGSAYPTLQKGTTELLSAAASGKANITSTYGGQSYRVQNVLSYNFSVPQS